MRAVKSKEVKVVKYLEIYRDFLQENSLNDDSDSIKIGDLIDFVENNVPVYDL